MGSADLDEAANIVMADDAKICKGDFASGRKISEPADLVSVKRLFTSCRSEGKSVEIHYTLVKTKSGHLIQLAHLNLGGATGNVATADSAFIRCCRVILLTPAEMKRQRSRRGNIPWKQPRNKRDSQSLLLKQPPAGSCTFSFRSLQ